MIVQTAASAGSTALPQAVSYDGGISYPALPVVRSRTASSGMVAAAAAPPGSPYPASFDFLVASCVFDGVNDVEG